ncbi:MAG: undecaprenyldiphospho-muramoylpentapeptide beta-N-acetylglucosaminyltransferase [Clostridia bacterium]|nr:undecaprenyldiphospho-muramoylpentapeptide beta-N-acetylglucosaminyltransferase [Clostridia bacterium]
MRILFATGGTGGHINPALAVANRIKAVYGDEAEILFVGTPDHMEARLVPNAGYDFKTIRISGFQRSFTPKNIARNIATLFRIVSSSQAAVKIIKEFVPDVVVGFGGYVSGPVLNDAHKLGIPIAIHEQNAFPGITNKSLAKVADVVMLTSEEARERMECKNEPVITGLPVRDELINADRAQARAALGLPDDKIFILSMGGSLGAEAVNKAVTGLIVIKEEDHDCIFMHAYGQYGKWVPDSLAELGVDVENRDDIILREYIDDMQVCMPAADILICRAGASSLYEIRALGKASILIPSPNVAENHQYYNAMELVKGGAAKIIEEKDLTPVLLADTINELLANPDQIREMEKNAKSMAILNATDLIVENIVKLVKPKEEKTDKNEEID